MVYTTKIIKTTILKCWLSSDTKIFGNINKIWQTGILFIHDYFPLNLPDFILIADLNKNYNNYITENE